MIYVAAIGLPRRFRAGDRGIKTAEVVDLDYR
jgi:hypothetical protein